MTTQPKPSPGNAVAALHAAAARDYARAQDPTQQAAARNQLADARAHGNEQAGNR